MRKQAQAQTTEQAQAQAIERIEAQAQAMENGIADATDPQAAEQARPKEKAQVKAAPAEVAKMDAYRPKDVYIAAGNALKALDELAAADAIMSTKKDAEGREVAVYIENPTLAKQVNKAAMLDALASVSLMAVCIELAEIDYETVHNEGFSSVVEFVVGTGMCKQDEKTLQGYWRVGMVFGVLGEDHARTGYHWKPDIKQAATVTNLRQVLSLLNLPKRFIEKCTRDEIEDAYDEFVEKYIDTGKINPAHTNAEVRKEINEVTGKGKAKKEDINTTATDLQTGDTVGAKQTAEEAQAQTTEEAQEQTAEQAEEAKRQARNQRWRDTLSEMAKEFESNPEVAKALAVLVAVIK